MGYRMELREYRRTVWSKYRTANNCLRILAVESITCVAKCVPGERPSPFLYFSCSRPYRDLLFYVVVVLSVNCKVGLRQVFFLRATSNVPGNAEPPSYCVRPEPKIVVWSSGWIAFDLHGRTSNSAA